MTTLRRILPSLVVGLSMGYLVILNYQHMMDGRKEVQQTTQTVGQIIEYNKLLEENQHLKARLANQSCK